MLIKVIYKNNINKCLRVIKMLRDQFIGGHHGEEGS